MPTDFSDIVSVVTLAGVVGGIVAIGAVKMAPVATKWAVNKVISMFGR